MTPKPVQIPVAGATLLGERWMGDRVAVALLHAGVCDRRCWREVGEGLAAAGCDVVAYDRRGFGQVPPADRPFRHVDDLLAVIDAVSPHAPAWLIGSSMGGEVALDAALEAPERVAGLVLLAPAVGGDPDPDEAAFNAATNGLAGAIDASWTAGDLEACNRLEVRLWLDGPAGPEGRVSGPPRELALEMNRIVIANGEPKADGASGIDAASRLKEMTIPAIVACGELDVPTKVRRSAELADALPNATYRTLPGRAHLPYLEAPAEVAASRTKVSDNRAKHRFPDTTWGKACSIPSTPMPRSATAPSTSPSAEPRRIRAVAPSRIAQAPAPRTPHAVAESRAYAGRGSAVGACCC